MSNGNACGSATSLGTINPGGSASGSGTVTPTGQSWYAITFPTDYSPNLEGGGSPTITVTGTSVLMNIYVNSCAATSTCGASSYTSGYTSWHFIDNASPAGLGTFSTRNVAWPTTVYVEVYNTTSSCEAFSIAVTR
jgi:hypothetical protein